MKTKLLPILTLALCLCVLLSGCGKTLTYGILERDSALTGGNLSFVYDENTHTATFGGEGEVVAYYPAELELGRSAGNRIGVKIYAPSEITDYSKAKLNFEGSEYVGGSFMTMVYDQVQNYFVLTPIVSENHRELKVYVTWLQDSEQQTYTIKIADGTKFASA